MASVVEVACKEVLGRTGGAGFPLICDDYDDSREGIFVRGVERAGATAINFTGISKRIAVKGRCRSG